MSDEARSRRDLTADSLAHLLARLSDTPADAAERYNALRMRLVQFFYWRRCEGPEELADDVLNRVARRIAEGEQIANLPGYVLSVARLVALEAYERTARHGRALEEYSRHLEQVATPDEDEAALRCLDRCLSALTPDRREQLLAYYTGSHAARIERRRQMARALDVGQVALRNRMLRMRQRLESCLDDCLTARADRDGSLGRSTDRWRQARSRRDEDPA